MKIIIVGSDKIFAIENFYAKHLRELGVQVIHFPAQSIFSEYYQKNLVNKLFFKTGFSSIYSLINEQLLSIVGNESPDAVWIFKGMEIFPETLQKIKAKKIKLVNYNPDNPFIFSGRGSGNVNITKSVSIYDLHFTYNLSIQKQLEAEVKAKVVILPFGFEVSEALYRRCAEQPEVNRVCFLGNPDKTRALFISALAERDIVVDVYGNNWDTFVNHKGITTHPPVYGDDQWMVLRKYRIQLNLMRGHNEDSHNMRTFETPGVGGIMLAPDTTEHRMFFENEKEAFLFRDVIECAGKIKKIMSLSPDSAMKVREAARARCLNSGYDYRSRTEQALRALKNLTNHE